jgi:transglutaminase-like putative cysteine protease
MQLRVLHRTRYLYRSPVTDSFNEVRLRPASDDPKRLLFYLLKVHPPHRLRHRRDAFHNYVQWFEMPSAHSELVIEATSNICTTSQYDDGKPLGISFDAIAMGEHTDMVRPFLTSSRYITVNQAIWRLAVDALPDRTGIFETAEAIMAFINQGWTYAPNTTSATTHMEQVLVDRRGVCQDFAHLMIGMCRSIGIPARYVSGYLYNGPRGILRGAQASHAWCEIWLPGRGWYGLDPTNNTLADERYIKIATGRDYDDAAPIRGSFNGPPGVTERLEVTVEVEER